ncbi:MAG: UxaA family hydrolase [Firmicutes bacterium]|nr:UxaA family hydrolase [Bacillota bacterium]
MKKAADNPTQGNKAGGLTTLEEKSLGCIQKGGHCAVMEVLKYGAGHTKEELD